MSPEEIAALEQAPRIDCPKCGWIHLASRPCAKTKWTPALGSQVAAISARGVDPYEKFKEWEARAQANPTTAAPTGHHCPVCHLELLRFRNFLGVEWVGYPVDADHDEDQETHTERHAATARQAGILPTLKEPRRAGLPYADD